MTIRILWPVRSSTFDFTGDLVRGKYTFVSRTGDFSFDRLNGAGPDKKH
jgi:hypothetical protein